MRFSTVMALLIVFLSLVGCGGGVASDIIGTWVGTDIDDDVEVTFEIKKDGTMIAKGGPMQFNMTYKVEKTEGNTAHLSIMPAGMKDEEPETLQMKVEGKKLTVLGSGLFEGEYKRK